MKALILVGGYGTRLRPLTLTVPKSLIEFCNQPVFKHEIEALVDVGITEIIFAINQEQFEFENYISEICQSVIQDKNINVHFSYESDHLGTAGPLAQAVRFLSGSEKPFFVLNSDIICNFPFRKMIDFHALHGKEGTMAVTKVEEPNRYGAVVYNDKSGAVKCFVEKPKDFVASKINAGLYIFSPNILKRIMLQPTSIELEIFPKMVEEGELYCMEFSGFWMDIGQPDDFVHGIRIYLSYLYEIKSKELSKIPCVLGNVLIHEDAKIGKNCRIGPNVTIAADVIIEDGVRIRNAGILSGAIIRSHALLDHCIIGWKSVVGRWARIENGTVLGEDVHVSDEVALNGALVLPHNFIHQSVFEPQVIM